MSNELIREVWLDPQLDGQMLRYLDVMSSLGNALPISGIGPLSCWLALKSFSSKAYRRNMAKSAPFI